MSEACEVESYQRGALTVTTHDRHIIANAFNERCSELGRGHPAAYPGDENGAHS